MMCGLSHNIYFFTFLSQLKNALKLVTKWDTDAQKHTSSFVRGPTANKN